MRRALLSVTDKTGIVEFARELVVRGFEIVSTGGTSRVLTDSSIPVIDVRDITQIPEMLDGRVKTLHPKIHGGILANLDLESHRKQLEDFGIFPIELVCVNLYAFEKQVLSSSDEKAAIESIDIGGPAMIRAAAKNHAHVTVLVDHTDYKRFFDAFDRNDLENFRKEMACRAFQHTSFYDSLIARFFAPSDEFPNELTWSGRKRQTLRYGENPHQSAALYSDPFAPTGMGHCKVLWGKELSYNNLLDADAAFELVQDLPEQSCAIIKHGNPCGAATMPTCGKSYSVAKQSDPISAFGGIAAFHGEVDQDAALAMTEKGNFLEVVVAESFSEQAIDIFKTRSGWGQDVRLCLVKTSDDQPTRTLRSIRGGFLIQDLDLGSNPEWNLVTSRKLTDEEWNAVQFAWRIIPHVKSNAIVVTNEHQLLGVGAGQMNRVQSVKLALEQAAEASEGAVLASDAFFPFPDSIEVASQFGIKVVVQPGGSKKDPEVIEKANKLGISMVMTGYRHFRH